MPYQDPWPGVLGRVLSMAMGEIVVLVDAAGQILGLSDVEPALRILKNVNEEGQLPE